MVNLHYFTNKNVISITFLTDKRNWAGLHTQCAALLSEHLSSRCHRECRSCFLVRLETRLTVTAVFYEIKQFYSVNGIVIFKMHVLVLNIYGFSYFYLICISVNFSKSLVSYHKISEPFSPSFESQKWMKETYYYCDWQPLVGGRVFVNNTVFFSVDTHYFKTRQISSAYFYPSRKYYNSYMAIPARRRFFRPLFSRMQAVST